MTSYDEEMRLVATCPACGSDRIYVTDMLCGFGPVTSARVECADCKKFGETWTAGDGLKLEWDGAEETIPTDYVTPFSP